MNDDIDMFVKFLAETDKMLIEKDQNHNLTKEQKELLKKFVDECYKNYKNKKSYKNILTTEQMFDINIKEAYINIKE